MRQADQARNGERDKQSHWRPADVKGGPTTVTADPAQIRQRDPEDCRILQSSSSNVCVQPGEPPLWTIDAVEICRFDTNVSIYGHRRPIPTRWVLDCDARRRLHWRFADG